MNCRTCGYSLFNLPTNACPECGSAFDLRTYKFQPESVAFACPYCDHQYAGHGPNYLPSEAQQVECLNCGQTVHTVQFRVVPLRPDAMAIDPQRVPWERREIVGFWRAWWQTWKMAATEPRLLASQLGTGQSWLPALGFAAITHGLASITSIVLFLIMFVVGFTGNRGGGMGVTWSASSGLPICSGWLFTLVWMVITIAAAHVVLLTGARREGWNMTARALCYAQAPFLIGAIPIVLCGSLIGWVWYVVVGTVILAEAQRVSQAKALIATAWLMLLAVGTGLLLLVLVIGQMVIR